MEEEATDVEKQEVMAESEVLAADVERRAQSAVQHWKKACAYVAQAIKEERDHQSFNKDEVVSFADVVQAVAAYDPDGRIHVDFNEDDESDDLTDVPEPDAPVESQPISSSRPSSDAGLNVPIMTICIMVVGTHGDVQPFVAIAKRLLQDGHRVRLATHGVYRDFVMSHGVEFYPLAGDPKELSAYMVKTGGHLIPIKLETIQTDVPRNIEMIEEILDSTWPAVSEADPDGRGRGIPGDSFQAQAIISNPVTYGHIHVAERLGVPLHIMFPQPWVPTTAFPHPLSNMPYTGKAKRMNYMSYKMVDLLIWQGIEGIVNTFRREKLQLRRIRSGRGILLDLAIPHAFMWSPRLVPKPADWGEIYDVIGTVTLTDPSSSYTPSSALEAFLGTDGGPIFVGFGSMVLQDPKAVTTMIIEAAVQAQVRVLIQSSWSDMAGDLTLPHNVFILKSCPHDWLLHRVSAVVHHGGAGTTAAGLLAGKPTFIVPFFGDQPFWGRAVLDAGVGIAPCPISQLTTEKLRFAFEALQIPQLTARAIAMRDLMQQEDGAGEAVTCFYQNLPLHVMQCDLSCGRAATTWNEKDQMRLCDECAFVVKARPEHSRTDFVEYSYVDYSAHGPETVFEGASAGVGALACMFGSNVKDVIVKPAQGYREDGAKGAVVGLVKGISGLLVSPLVGTVVFADHLATGAYNNVHGSGRKKCSLIVENKKLLHAMGIKTRNNAHNGSMSADEAMDGNDVLYTQIAVQLTPEEKSRLAKRFLAHMEKRARHEPKSLLLPSCSEGTDKAIHVATAVTKATRKNSSALDQDFDGALHDGACEEEETQKVPIMTICMMTTGTWEESVQQYVAIGLRLKADGHRVRIAASSGHRDRIIKSGLEFYPLGGTANTTHDYVQYLSQRSQDQPRHISGLLNLAYTKLNSHRESFSDVDDLRELVFSLWPACVEVDPMMPGTAFRADAIIAHPYVFGQTEVAERLGVPLHCLSHDPQSRTQAFPHLISLNIKLHRPYRYAPINAASYDVFDNVLWNSMRDILDDFRHSLDLPGKSIANNLLADWRIPHTYLWNPALLPRPHDWECNSTIVGYVALADNDLETTTNKAIEQELQSFATSSAGTPLIYVGMQCGEWDQRRVQDLLLTLESAAQKANVRVVFQGYANGHDQDAIFISGTRAVFEIDQQFPVKRILPFVHATVHWGDVSITSVCLAAGKAACVIPRDVTQRMWGQALLLSGAGVEPLELDALTPTNLVHVFRVLLDPKLAHCAKRLAPTFSSSNAIESAVSRFYSNLPLAHMTCDLDPARIARVYDSLHEMKLSYEGRLVVHQITKDGGSASDLKYKPLKYSQFHPPQFSLRELEAKVLYTYDPVSEEVAQKHDSERVPTTSFSSSALTSRKFGTLPCKTRCRLSRMQSMALNVVERPAFWQSPEEQLKCTEAINANYERLLMTRTLSSDPLSSSAS